MRAMQVALEVRHHNKSLHLIAILDVVRQQQIVNVPVPGKLTIDLSGKCVEFTGAIREALSPLNSVALRVNEGNMDKAAHIRCLDKLINEFLLPSRVAVIPVRMLWSVHPSAKMDRSSAIADSPATACFYLASVGGINSLVDGSELMLWYAKAEALPV